MYMEWGEFRNREDLSLPHQDLFVGLSAPAHFLSLRTDYVFVLLDWRDGV